MAFDPNLPRWIKASVYKYFSDGIAPTLAMGQGCPIYFNNYKGDQSWAELRMDGPMIEEYECQSYRIDITVDILITAFIGSDDYALDRLVGFYGSLMDYDICCYKYGNGPQDDQSQFGVLQLYPSKRNKVDIVNFGLIAPEAKQKRSCCEAPYTMWL